MGAVISAWRSRRGGNEGLWRFKTDRARRTGANDRRSQRGCSAMAPADRLKHRFEREEREHLNQSALAGVYVGLRAETHLLAVDCGPPLDCGATRSCRLEVELVTVRRLHDRFEACGDLARQLRTVDDHSDLGVDVERTLVEIHRANERPLTIDDDHLRMKPELVRASGL